MNKQETMQLLAVLREYYPNGKEVTQDTVNAWHLIFEALDYNEVWQAVITTVKSDESYTMPPPATILKNMPQKDTPIERWHIAEKAIRKGQSFTAEDFKKLPEDIQKYFGSAQAIREMGLMDIENLSYEKTRFLSNIEIIQKRQAEAPQLESITKLIG